MYQSSGLGINGIEKIFDGLIRSYTPVFESVIDEFVSGDEDGNGSDVSELTQNEWTDMHMQEQILFRSGTFISVGLVISFFTMAMVEQVCLFISHCKTIKIRKQ